MGQALDASCVSCRPQSEEEKEKVCPRRAELFRLVGRYVGLSVRALAAASPEGEPLIFRSEYERRAGLRSLFWLRVKKKIPRLFAEPEE